MGGGCHSAPRTRHRHAVGLPGNKPSADVCDTDVCDTDAAGKTGAEDTRHKPGSSAFSSTLSTVGHRLSRGRRGALRKLLKDDREEVQRVTFLCKKPLMKREANRPQPGFTTDVLEPHDGDGEVGSSEGKRRPWRQGHTVFSLWQQAASVGTAAVSARCRHLPFSFGSSHQVSLRHTCSRYLAV